jgi:hypothetical protein
MLRAVEGGCILGLLAVFLAYLLAPALDTVQRRIKVGRRQRPLSRSAAILLIYSALAIVGVTAWRIAAPIVRQWTHVTAPALLERVFTGGKRADAIERLYASVPLPARARPMATRATIKGLGSSKISARSARRASSPRRYRPLAGGHAGCRVPASRLRAWLPPPTRVPPRPTAGRGDEYFRDANSALAEQRPRAVRRGPHVGVGPHAGVSLFGLPRHLDRIPPVCSSSCRWIGPLTVGRSSRQAGDRAIPIVAFLIALRVVQDYVVYPRLVRRGMHLSSPAVIFAVWCGAALNGAAGVVLSIPVAGFLSVSLRHWREYRSIERLVRQAAIARGE